MSFPQETTKGFFSSYPDKEALSLFIVEHLKILSDDERRVLILKHCMSLPFKCVAAEMNISERWAKRLHARALVKAAPVVYPVVLKAIAASL